MKLSRSIFLQMTVLSALMTTLLSCVSQAPAANPAKDPGKKIIVTDGPAKAAFGVRLASMSTEAPDDLLELAFESEKEYAPSWSIGSTSGIDTSKIVEHSKLSPTKHVFDLSFSAAGTYSFTLFSYDAAKKTNDPIMSFRIEATGVQAPSGLPDNWTASKRFRFLGVKLRNASPKAVDDTLSFELEMPPGTKANCTLMHKESKTYSFVRETAITDTASRFAAPLDKQGEYSLSVSVTPAGEKYPVRLAQAVYDAEIPKDSLQFRVEGDEPWPRLPIKTVQEAKEDWYAPAGSFPYTTRYRAILQDDFSLKAPMGALSLKKGAALDFGCRNGTTMATLFEVTLDADISRLVDGKELSFRAGTKYSFDDAYEGGKISKPATILAEGIEFDCPKDCYVAFDGNGLTAQILPKGQIVIRADGKALTTEGEIYLAMRTYEDDFRPEVTLSKPASFVFGGASFTLPAGSEIVFRKGKPYGFITGKETDIVANGKKTRVAASMYLSLDEKGSLRMEQAKGGK